MLLSLPLAALSWSSIALAAAPQPAETIDTTQLDDPASAAETETAAADEAPQPSEAAPEEPAPDEPAPEEAATEAAPKEAATEASVPADSPPAKTEAEAPNDSAASDETTDNEDDSTERVYPRIVIAGGPMVGPHTLGNEQCSSEMARCEKKGVFFGVGGHVEVRARVWRPIAVHVRGLAIKNVAPTDRVYAGMLGLGGGVGAYGRRIFGRAEYLFVHALGDNRFEPPFFDGEVARDTWGKSAGLISVGFRQPLPRNLAVELWGGLMIGPHSVREVPQQEPDERNLVTFQIGLNVAWDAWR